MRMLVFIVAAVLLSASEARAYSFRLLDAQLVAPDEGGGDTIVIFRDAPRVPMEPPPAKFACFWNMLWPGLGQIVLGKALRGLLFMAGVFVPMGLAAMLIVSAPSSASINYPAAGAAYVVGFGVWGWSFIDAWMLGSAIDGK